MYWFVLGKVQEIGDMNIVSQMCAIAVMFVIMYFYISQKKDYITYIEGFLLRYGLQACCHFSFDIFSLVAIEKKKRISSYCYQYYLQIISLDGYMGCHGGLLVYLCGYFQEKKSLRASGENGCGYLESPLIF